MIHSNIVDKKTYRGVQLEVLECIKNALVCSFGPMGSNTVIKKEGDVARYTKDGHSILQELLFHGPLEAGVKDDLTNLTLHIVKTVGDGTTSAIILSALIFKGIVAMESDVSPVAVVNRFKTVVDGIVEIIKSNGNPVTLDDIYKIALISTNGNEEVAGNIRKIYEEFGMNVFVDVSISNNVDNVIKIYDGLTLEAGYADGCFVNNKAKAVATINKPKVYVFEHPIDTPEMIRFFDSIIVGNIITPASSQDPDVVVVPTVILAPKLSNDMSSYMERLAEFMYGVDPTNRPPFLLVTNLHFTDEFMDIARLCGAKTIKKYLDPKIQANDIEQGLAPTLETILDFCGSCDLVESDVSKTKFINPARLKNEDGSYTITYRAMLSFLEGALENASSQGEDSTTITRLKRRINSLKSNMVEYLVGGVSMVDRDSLRDLVEDAVLNCRSAAKEGFGYGANFEGFRAANEYFWDNDNDAIAGIIVNAYNELVTILYDTYTMDSQKSENLKNESSEKGMPFNLRTGEFDGNVLSSINSDIVILETIAKIVTLMFTSNQFLCPSPVYNVYVSPEE